MCERGRDGEEEKGGSVSEGKMSTSVYSKRQVQ